MRNDGYDVRTIVHQGRELNVYWIRDDDHEPPWKDGDGRGVVIENAKHLTKKPGQIKVSSQCGSQFFFDWEETTKKAKAEGWGLGVNGFMALTARHRRAPTRNMVAREAVLSEYEFFRGWLHDDWFYCGIVVEDVETGVDESLWGIESNSEEYIEEVILDLAEQVYIPAVEALLTRAA